MLLSEPASDKSAFAYFLFTNGQLAMIGTEGWSKASNIKHKSVHTAQRSE